MSALRRHAAVPERQSPQGKLPVIQAGRTPAGALTWSTGSNARSRTDVLIAWRRAVLSHFPRCTRAVGCAWLIGDLVAKEGYAWPTNGHLARETGLPVKAVEAALTSLERAGAIVRVLVSIDSDRWQRRIFLGRGIVEKTGQDTPP